MTYQALPAAGMMAETAFQRHKTRSVELTEPFEKEIAAGSRVLLQGKVAFATIKTVESTPKVNSGAISSIIRFPYPAIMTLAASSTVHQPGRVQNALQISQLHASDDLGLYRFYRKKKLLPIARSFDSSFMT
jgi:hypothetical protein